MKSVAVIGDNCVDYYSNLNRYYLTGNIVDTGINLSQLGVPTSILTTVADDEYGKAMIQCFKEQNLNISHVKIAHGDTAITYMQLMEKERIHGDYVEGVLANMVFHSTDIHFAASHNVVHSAFWGKAEGVLPDIKKTNPECFISFDFADRLESHLVKELDGIVDIGFFSYREKDERILDFLKERRKNGMKIAVATFGENGSLALSANHVYEAGIVKTEVVNTVGAGDSFIAGFLSSYIKNGNIERSLEEGAKLAAYIISIFEPWENKRQVEYDA